MSMTKEDLKGLGTEELVNNLVRAVELDTKNSGSGNSPFDQNQLKEEIIYRLNEKGK